ncbi:hypothetical protein M8994_19475 [Brucella sp. 21LCYQ03]|nr:hypothetical protein [Brucella sp. 21LCYQ03]
MISTPCPTLPILTVLVVSSVELIILRSPDPAVPTFTERNWNFEFSVNSNEPDVPAKEPIFKVPPFNVTPDATAILEAESLIVTILLVLFCGGELLAQFSEMDHSLDNMPFHEAFCADADVDPRRSDAEIIKTPLANE